MKALSCCVAFALAGVAVAVVACSDSNSPPSGPQAASVTGIAGDSQVGATSHPLDFPLALTTLGSNGQPVQGVAVSWSATPSNGAAFNPQTSPSDVNGIASTVVTLGAVEDTIVITATIPGVQQPVVFHELSVNPCSFGRPFTIGSTFNQALTTTDCNAGGYYNDFFLLSPAAQTGMTINMTGNFDTWIDMYVDNGQQLLPVGFHDDISSSNLNSRLSIVAAPADYVIAPNTANPAVTGNYTLTSTTHAESASGCEQLFVTYGVVLNDNVAATDCPDSTAVGTYGDSLKIVVINGQVVKIAERSGAVDPYLRLFHVVFRAGQSDSLELVAFNDDSSGTTTNAYISHLVPGTPGAQARLYIIFAGTGATGAQTGAYTLDISANTTLSGLARSTPQSAWAFSLGKRVIPQLGLHRGL